MRGVVPPPLPPQALLKHARRTHLTMMSSCWTTPRSWRERVAQGNGHGDTPSRARERCRREHVRPACRREHISISIAQMCCTCAAPLVGPGSECSEPLPAALDARRHANKAYTQRDVLHYIRRDTLQGRAAGSAQRMLGCKFAPARHCTHPRSTDARCTAPAAIPKAVLLHTAALR